MIDKYILGKDKHIGKLVSQPLHHLFSFSSTGEIPYFDPVIGLFISDIGVNIPEHSQKAGLFGISIASAGTQIYLYSKASCCGPGHITPIHRFAVADRCAGTASPFSSTKLLQNRNQRVLYNFHISFLLDQSPALGLGPDWGNAENGN